MTVVCSGGTSSPKPGISTSIVVDQAFIQSLLPPALAWLYPYLPFMHGLEIGDVPTFCSVDPPTWTVPSVLDIYNFVVGGPIGSVVLVNQFLQDITKAYLWYSICKCDSVTTPAAPAAPSAPPNLPAINPPTVVSPAPTIACYTNTVIAPGNPYCGGNNPGLTLGDKTSGRNITGVRVTVVMTPTSGAGFTGALRLNWFNATSNIRVDISPIRVVAGTTVHIFPGMPSGALQSQPQILGDGISGVDCGNVTTTVEYFCNGAQPGGYTSPCCPPDATATALLRRINQMVTLVQRQIAPFGSIDGPSHSGATGNGHADIDEPLLGIRVELTTIPDSYGRQDGDPGQFFDLGYVSLGNEDQWFGSRRVDNETIIWQPRWAGMVTRVGWSLEPGVVATITELEREP